MSRRRIWFGISLTIIAIGLIFAIVRGLNIGIDFTGGTQMQVHMGKVVEVSAVEKALAPHKLSPEIIHIGADKKDIMIRTKVSLNNEKRDVIFKSLKDAFQLTDKVPVSVEQIGPSVGNEIKMNAFWGVVASCIFILMYITFRFEIVFGVAAIVALLHDVFVLLAVYSIFYIPVDTSFIAAMLTVLGYSVMDTVVIFDRIRENLRDLKKGDYDALADRSVMEVLRRSIITSAITITLIFLLYIFGVESIKNFTFPLLVGIAAGTYSSIFIASPIWTFVKKRQKTKFARA